MKPVRRERNGEDAFTLGGKRYVAKEISVCERCVFADFPGDCWVPGKYPKNPQALTSGQRKLLEKSAMTQKLQSDEYG